ncbi:MAG: GNAT family N-acetyltransferase [Pseudomonadota bacterium]
MDALNLDFRPADPTDPQYADLFDRHLKLMHASSPACSVHAKPASGLAGAHVTFLVAHHGETPVAMGAVQDLGDGLFEVKSMHVTDACRGRGIAKDLLGALLTAARSRGATRISLETGSQPVFEPARALYRSAGFEPCAPFADYTDDPNSFYMSLDVSA